jgi:hypothetical protein
MPTAPDDQQPTRAKPVDVPQYWRIALCVLGGAIVATALWQALFPHTMWFKKLWAGSVTGGVVGMLPGMGWQWRNKDRRAATSWWILVIAFLCWGAFAVISVIDLAPQMKAEEAQRTRIRSLLTQDIVAIEISSAGQKRRLDDDAAIRSFVRLARNANLFYPSHEGSVQEYELQLVFHDGKTVAYRARVPQRHRDGPSLGFRGPSHWAEVIVPNGGHWAERVTGIRGNRE